MGAGRQPERMPERGQKVAVRGRTLYERALRMAPADTYLRVRSGDRASRDHVRICQEVSFLGRWSDES